MQIKRARALVAVNVLLLALLATVLLSPHARAGAGQPARARGSYTMVGGQYQGGTSNAIYIVDAANQEMIALRWDESRKSLSGIGYRNLNEDATAEPGR